MCKQRPFLFFCLFSARHLLGVRTCTGPWVNWWNQINLIPVPVELWVQRQQTSKWWSITKYCSHCGILLSTRGYWGAGVERDCNSETVTANWDLQSMWDQPWRRGKDREKRNTIFCTHIKVICNPLHLTSYRLQTSLFSDALQWPKTGKYSAQLRGNYFDNGSSKSCYLLTVCLLFFSHLISCI